jgi:hypothetical protein
MAHIDGPDTFDWRNLVTIEIRDHLDTEMRYVSGPATAGLSVFAAPRRLKPAAQLVSSGTAQAPTKADTFRLRLGRS